MKLKGSCPFCLCIGLAVTLTASTTARAQIAQEQVEGTVRDSATGRPLVADVRAVVAGTATRSGADGGFNIMIATTSDTLVLRCIGCRPARHAVTPSTGPVVILLAPLAITLPEVVVQAEPVPPGLTVLSGEALSSALAGSVAATIASEPGIVLRYNGPVASQPVLRGLGGDRVLVLEDGQRTGDIATTAADHAVTIDPMTAERIEVLRGPAGLVYGGNAVGGVVNVVRGDIPESRGDWQGTLRMQAESMNRGITGAAQVDGALGPVAVRGALAQRHAGDSRTPTGRLPRTDLDGYDGGVGLSYQAGALRVGAAVRDVTSYYGVPSAYQGKVIPGAHDGGVYIDLRRTTARLEAELRPRSGAITSVELTGSANRFEQDELERGGLVGTRFGQQQGEAQLRVRYQRSALLPATGSLGVSLMRRDWRASGSYTGTRPAIQQTVGGFLLEEYRVGRVSLQAGARLDHTTLEPFDTSSSFYLQQPRDRDFTGLSGALSVTVNLTGSIATGVTVARAVRTPAVEELYSNGPHLANYAYEVGNPRLDPEVARGIELFVRGGTPRWQFELTGYRNQIDHFTEYRPLIDPVTGRPVLDFRLHRYVVYQAQQTNAELLGGEGRVRWTPGSRLSAELTGSLIRGTERESEEPLAAMPPLQGRVRLQYRRAAWDAGVELDGATAQRRVPSLPHEPVTCEPGNECPPIPGEYRTTDGHLLVNLTAGLRWQFGGLGHQVQLRLDNAGNQTWRDHLSRIKTVAPQPGRNLRLLYEVAI